jgi:hypothetical protein
MCFWNIAVEKTVVYGTVTKEFCHQLVKRQGKSDRFAEKLPEKSEVEAFCPLLLVVWQGNFAGF